jgi:geranylgeranyl diphosphate synthase type I
MAVLMDFSQFVARHSGEINREISAVLPASRSPYEVYGLIEEFLARGGKRFRPLLCVLSCEAVGGDPKLALPAAASIELFHNFTLIHDDIEDNSLLRRGEPCLHIKHGTPLAINAGDGLFMLVWRAAQSLRLPPERKLHVQSMLLDSFTSVLEGQALELGWLKSGKFDVTEQDYLRMAAGKTGALISAACSVGAYIGGGSEKEVAALHDFGESAGLSFQIKDDVLNLRGVEEKYKKEIGGDITEGKRTLITIHSLSHAGAADARELNTILKSRTRSPQKIRRAISIMEKTGSIAYADSYADRLMASGRSSLSALKKSEALSKLLELSGYLTRRQA